jgi:hypothetical protein
MEKEEEGGKKRRERKGERGRRRKKEGTKRGSTFKSVLLGSLDTPFFIGQMGPQPNIIEYHVQLNVLQSFRFFWLLKKI